MIVFLLITAPLLVAFVFLLVVQLNTNAQPSQWAVVFIPIWLLFLIWLIYIFVLLWKTCVRGTKPVKATNRKWTLCFHVFAFIALLAFTVSISAVLGAAGEGGISTIGITCSFIPLWIFMFGLLLYSLGCRCCSINRSSYWMTSIGYTLFFLIVWTSILIFTILLVTKISNRSSITWNITFIPLWISFFFCFVSIAYAFYAKYRKDSVAIEKNIKTIELLYYIVVLIALLVFVVFLNIELNNPTTIGCPGLFLPLMLLFLIAFIMGFTIDYMTTMRIRISGEGNAGVRGTWEQMDVNVLNKTEL